MPHLCSDSAPESTRVELEPAKPHNRRGKGTAEEDRRDHRLSPLRTSANEIVYIWAPRTRRIVGGVVWRRLQQACLSTNREFMKTMNNKMLVPSSFLPTK